MKHEITVKGIGEASAKPDQVAILMTIESRHKLYEEAMRDASLKIMHLTESLKTIGFKKSDLKTMSFNVETEYDNRRDNNGNYHRVFEGYLVEHALKLTFDFEMDKLSQAISVIAGCIAEPQLNIRFTVKDKSALNDEMLRSAAKSARRKAEVLCEASGVRLGDLVSIDYNWGELDIYSHTTYKLTEECLAEPTAAMEIEPDDIEINDTVTFVWEIA